MKAVRFFLFLFSLMASPAFASVQIGGVTIDPQNLVRPQLLSRALDALSAHPQARRDTIAVVDFAAPSPAARFFIVDLKSGAVEAFRTAHGRGSDLADRTVPASFSNEANSNASSLGAYLAARPYTGKHGLSLSLIGLDKTNSNAQARAVVLHSAPYMTDQFVAVHGRPGRSWGCFVVDPKFIDHVVTRLENGALIYAGV